MAKVKLKVQSTVLLPGGKARVAASNADSVYAEKVFTLEDKEITEAQSKKLKPGEFRKRRVKVSDRVSLQVEVDAGVYKVGDEITLSF